MRNFDLEKQMGIYDKWFYFGKINPERFPISFIKINNVCKYDAENLELLFDISVTDSIFVLDIYVLKGHKDIVSFMEISKSFVISLVDVLVYYYEIRLDVEIISGIHVRTNQKYVFGNKSDVLNRPSYDKTDLEGISRISTAITKDTALRYVLANFREALRVPLHTVFYCYRAIESMMQSMKEKDIPIKGSTENDKPYWKKLQTALKVSKETMVSVGNHAIPPRHGKSISMNLEQREKIIVITDKIIKRYIDYLTADKCDLSAADYPILSEEVP